MNDPKYPIIIDNIQRTMGSVLNDLLPKTKIMKIGVGYFYLGGFYVIKENYKSIKKISIVIGSETDKRTGMEIDRGYIEREIRKTVQEDLELVEEDTDDFEGVLELHSLIEQGICDVRIYTERHFHPKLYLLTRNDDQYAIVGSSNFSFRGFGGRIEDSNVELNLIMNNMEVFNSLDEWYDARYDEAKDFTTDLLKYITSSKSFKRYITRERDPAYITPFELYKLMMYNVLDGDVAMHRDALAEFQKIGVENAKEKIKRFNGVILSDSVGLGKTFIGAEIMSSARMRGDRILLIIPASKHETKDWNNVLKEFFGLNVNGKNINIVTIQKFTRCPRDDVVNVYGDYDLIVIDEAHRFRNPDSKGLKNLMELKGRPILLITATPLNNSITDLKSLIFTFATPNALTNARLSPTAFKQYEQIKKRMEKARKKKQDMAPYLRQMEAPLREINDILNHTMILRTRTIIKERYPNLRIGGVPVKFATPSIEKIKYDLGDAWDPVLERLIDFIFELSLPHIMVLNKNASQILRELFKITMLKRFESSPFAFYRSLWNIIDTEQAMLTRIKSEGLDTVLKERIAKRLELDDDDAINDVLDKDWDDDSLDEGVVQFEDGVAHDVREITRFMEDYLTRLKPTDHQFDFVDEKLDKLYAIINEHEHKKILIFTQFRDTAKYLFHHVSQMAENVDMVLGGDPEKKMKIARFCPRANPVDGRRLRDIEETHVMISTDTLSESVNLQDCRVVINYDLHWNPMRIVQRVGRIDRIGNDDPYKVYNFFPSDGIQRYLNLLDKIKGKIIDITRIVGKEFGILEEAEDVNIKTIGERITTIENINDMDIYEKIANNPILKVEGETERDRIRNEIRTRLKTDEISEDKFKIYKDVKYSIFKSTTDIKGLISLYHVFDKKNDRTLEMIFLHHDDQGTVNIISPFDVYVQDGTRGTTRKQFQRDFPNINLDEMIQRETDEIKNIVKSIREDYTDSMISKRVLDMSKIQKAVKNRLMKERGVKKLIDDDESLRKHVVKLSRIYSLTVLKTDTAIKLKRLLDQVATTINDIPLDVFVDALEIFFKEEVETNVEYNTELMRSRDVGWKHICWGYLW